MKNICVITIALIMFLGLVSGCGQVAPSSTTTTTTTNATVLGNSAATSASTVTSIANLASSSSSLGSGSTPSITSSGVKAKIKAQDAPPTSFTSAMPTDGYMDAPGGLTGETVKMRFTTLGGDIIKASFLNNKKLGSLEGFNWLSLSSGPPTGFNFLTAMVSFDAAAQYNNITTMWEYICFSEIAPQMTEAARLIFIPPGILPAYPAGVDLRSMDALSKIQGTAGFITSAEAKDYKMGGMDVHVVKSSGTRTCDITMTSAMTMDATLGHPVPDTMTGTGVVTNEGITAQLTISMTVNHTTGKPKSGTMTLVTSDGYTIALTVDANGKMDGTIKITATGVTVATIHLEADGSGYVDDATTGTRTTIAKPT